MAHGVEDFFAEDARAARRISTITVSLSGGMLALLLATLLPPFQRPIEQLLRQSTRFGYEGPDQFVRRITLQQFTGSSTLLRNVGSVDTRVARRGGGVQGRRVRDPNARPETRPRTMGPGLSDDELVARAVSRLPNVPIVQSEDLVIEHSVTPYYPDSEYERRTDGRVRVQALVDTAGRVVDVQLLASSGVEPFEKSAEEAVWQYRFKPYRPEGVIREVYVVLQFWFHVD